MRHTARIALKTAVLLALATGTFVAQSSNSWIEWSEETTTGEFCGSEALPWTSVTQSKQWHVQFKNTCNDQSQPTWLSADPSQTATGQCIGSDTGCYPLFQAYSGGGGSSMWWNAHATSRYWGVVFCGESTVEIFPLSAEPHSPSDPPCPDCEPDGSWCYEASECCSNVCGISAQTCGQATPIVISRSGRPRLSSPADGVLFDFWVNGRPFHIPWPRDRDTAWLVLDRNRNGLIDNGGELFGNRTKLSDGRFAPNGFSALADLDANHDGLLNDSDSLFSRLALWHDFQRNGVAEPGELVPLADEHIVALALEYKETRRTDQWGNEFKYRAPVFLDSGRRRFSYDVYFATDEGRDRDWHPRSKKRESGRDSAAS